EDREPRTEETLLGFCFCILCPLSSVLCPLSSVLCPLSSGSGSSRTSIPCRRSFLDRLDDAGVCAATANVALHPSADVLISWLRILVQECDAAHDHAGSAVAALQRADVQERLLHRWELA